MKKQFTKKQEDAINLLITDLDELENKPRRLYDALEKFAIAFDREDSVPGLRYAQDIFYSEINKGETFTNLYRVFRKYKIDIWRWQIKNDYEIGDAQTRITGAQEFMDLFIREETENYR